MNNLFRALAGKFLQVHDDQEIYIYMYSKQHKKYGDRHFGEIFFFSSLPLKSEIRIDFKNFKLNKIQ